MDVLTVGPALLVAIAILFEVARGLDAPYPTLFVLGGLGLALIPGLPAIELQPEIVLGIFLPLLLFIAARETPVRDLWTNVISVIGLSIGLVVFTGPSLSPRKIRTRRPSGAGSGSSTRRSGAA